MKLNHELYIEGFHAGTELEKTASLEGEEFVENGHLVDLIGVDVILKLFEEIIEGTFSVYLSDGMKAKGAHERT